MHVERDQGQSFLIKLSPQLVDFASVGQQPAHTQGIVVVIPACMGVGRDMHVVQLHFAFADQAETIPEIGLASPNGFHLGAYQFDAGFQRFQDVVLMPGQPVVGQ